MATNNNNNNNQRPSPFLALPRELRDEIYHLVLDDRRLNRLHPVIEHALVRTCRQSRPEALAINDAGTILPLHPACHQLCPNSCLRPNRPSLLLGRIGPRLVRRIGQIGDLFVSEQRLRYWLSPSGCYWGYEPNQYDWEVRVMQDASTVSFGNGVSGVSLEHWRYDVRMFLQMNGFEMRGVRERALVPGNDPPGEISDWKIMFRVRGEAGRVWLWWEEGRRKEGDAHGWDDM